MKNVIAVIWDFDKTLIDGYMQDPIFKEYNVEASKFWDEVNSLPQKYKEKGVTVNKDTIYLNHFLRYVKDGRFSGMTNEKLRSYGKQMNFYPGVLDLFERTIHLFDDDGIAKELNIIVEHYIVSTGFAEVIKGSKLNEYVSKVWGCELIEEDDDEHLVSEIGYTIDNTTKTRALFEINKGVNKDEKLSVNSKMDYYQRRVDFKNMIYIADGPSDVPAFSVIKQRGGATFAIYPKKEGNEKAFKQVEQLREEGRVDMFAEADYSEGTLADMWICHKIRQIRDRLVSEETIKRGVIKDGPTHITK